MTLKAYFDLNDMPALLRWLKTQQDSTATLHVLIGGATEATALPAIFTTITTDRALAYWIATAIQRGTLTVKAMPTRPPGFVSGSVAED